MTLHKDVASKRTINYFSTLEETYLQKHSSKYDYTNTIFKNTKTKIEIDCPLHGTFLQWPSDHLNGVGCPKCGLPKGNESQRLSTDDFIKRATERHEGKYAYGNTVVIHSKENIVVTCPIHGDFNVIPNNHLRDSGGCMKCRNKRLQENAPVWSYTKWEESGKASKLFDSFKLYVVECWKDSEHFIKIGKTYTSIHKRLGFHLPYEYKVLYSIEGSPKFISELEHSLHMLNKDFKHLPTTSFGGMHECFSINIKKYVEDQLNIKE